MYVTMAEMILLMDVLRASGKIADRKDLCLFGYSRESRQVLHKRLMARLDDGAHIVVGAEEDDDDS